MNYTLKFELIDIEAVVENLEIFNTEPTEV